MSAEKFAATLRDEALRRTGDRYVHNALIRTQMRTMADTIERWERMDFAPPARSLEAAIATVEDSRRTHVEWRDHWLSIPGHTECDGCKATAATAGDLAHQERCIAEYDNVLAVLLALAHPSTDPDG